MPVFAWMLVIFGASTDLGSMQQTSRFIVPFLNWLNPDLSFEMISQIQFLIRKTAHVTEYAILAFLLLRAAQRNVTTAFSRSVLLVALGAGVFAATDEFHQSFVSSRTASPKDVLIDCCGVLVGIAIYRAYLYGRIGRAVVANS